MPGLNIGVRECPLQKMASCLAVVRKLSRCLLESTELEIAYVRDTMPQGLLGMNAAIREEYLHYIANRR